EQSVAMLLRMRSSEGRRVRPRMDFARGGDRITEQKKSCRAWSTADIFGVASTCKSGAWRKSDAEPGAERSHHPHQCRNTRRRDDAALLASGRAVARIAGGCPDPDPDPRRRAGALSGTRRQAQPD